MEALLMSWSWRSLEDVNSTINGQQNLTDGNTTRIDDQVEFVETASAKLFALVCAIFAFIVSTYNIQQHLIYYTQPALQRSIIRILFIVPVYAVFSFFTLIMPKLSVYFDSVRDIWEAVVVYSFLSLLMEYCGGENACLSVIMNHPGAITHVWPINYCTPPIALTAGFLRWCKRASIQFVIIKPIMAVCNLVLVGVGKFEDPTYQIVLSTVYNLSYTIALYSLFLFYKATHEHPGIMGRSPLYKFLAVKTVVFATYYQSIIIPLFPNMTTEQAVLWNSFILCCEMVFFAVLHLFAFSSSEYKQKALKSPRHDDLKKGGNSAGTGGKDRDIEMANERDIAMHNARDVMSISDVAQDAYYNFNSKYKSHVKLGTENESGPNSQYPGRNSFDSQENEQEERPGMFGNIGRTFRSLKTGGAVRGSESPFQSANPFQVDDSGIDYARRNPEPHRHSDSDNPFIADYNDPLSLESKPKSKSGVVDIDLQ